MDQKIFLPGGGGFPAALLSPDGAGGGNVIWNTWAYQAAIAAEPSQTRPWMDFADIIGQDGAKRGVEIACAGAHNVLFVL